MWQEGRILLDDLVFYLDRDKNTPVTPNNDGFLLEKPVRLLHQYMAMWQSRSTADIKNILELGIYGGGSIAFWFQLIRPNKYVAIDLANWSNTEYFNKYITSHNLDSRIKTLWNVDQSDRKMLRQIVATEYNSPLDLIIDDASHLYAETRASFEVLFPLLKPGGLYIIEDWSWGCWPNLPVNFLPIGTELPRLIHQIVDAAGSMQRFLSSEPSNAKLRTINPLIASVTIYADIVVIERGGAAMADGPDFNLEGYITFRPNSNFLRRSLARARYLAAKIAKKMGYDTRYH